jgi:hypothetical protein
MIIPEAMAELLSNERRRVVVTAAAIRNDSADPWGSAVIHCTSLGASGSARKTRQQASNGRLTKYHVVARSPGTVSQFFP